MIILHNNYIFLPKDKKENIETPSKGANDTIRIQMKKRVFLYIRSIFGEPISEDTENIRIKNIYTYEMEIKNIKYEVIFTIYNITCYSYLDICVSGKTTNQVIQVLEYIQDKIVSSDIEKQ